MNSVFGGSLKRASLPLLPGSLGRYSCSPAKYSNTSKSTLAAVPKEEVISSKTLEELESKGKEEGVKLDLDLIHHLERTSLVDFGDEEALTRLEEAIKFADTLFEVDTKGVEPLTSVLENETLHLREDEVEPTSRKDILMNASLTEEDYFVAPPGNIPLEPQHKLLKKK